MIASDLAPRHRRIRSFVRREGRITGAQKEALERLWPRFGISEAAAPMDFETLFGRRAPVVMEIGFGSGDYLLSRAGAEPEKDFVGVEVHRPGVGRVLHRAEQAGLLNLRVACHDAVEVLRDGVVPGVLSEIVIYFPDPWPKKRHHKRRLIQPDFTQLAASRLTIGGRLLLATDWAEYAEQMKTVLNSEKSLRNCAADGGYVPRPAARPTTRFEARGERLGHCVFDLEFERVA
jgi:tRNA (guanine-N7-)-methyltransferase